MTMTYYQNPDLTIAWQIVEIIDEVEVVTGQGGEIEEGAVELETEQDLEDAQDALDAEIAASRAALVAEQDALDADRLASLQSAYNRLIVLELTPEEATAITGYTPPE